MPLAFSTHSLDPGLVFLPFLGVSSSVVLLSSNHYRGYSAIGRSRIQILLIIGEGLFSFILFSLVVLLTSDGLFMMERDFIVFISPYALSGLGVSFFLICIGERHPWDIPESESDLGGGFGVVFGGISFLLFAILEYR